jgi:hypothetical protein
MSPLSIKGVPLNCIGGSRKRGKYAKWPEKWAAETRKTDANVDRIRILRRLKI